MLTVTRTDDDRPAPSEDPGRRALKAKIDRGDQGYRFGSRLAGLFVLAIMAGVGLFLLLQGLQAMRTAGRKFITTQVWYPDVHHFGIAALIIGTLCIALTAVTVSFPLALGTSLFISEVAPTWLKRWLITLVDLMAAVPSVVFGLWGLFYFEGHFVGVARWISTWLGWIPIFKVSGADPTNPLASASVYTSGAAVAGIVVGLMVTPIATSVMREAFSQAPVGEREGALALGATRWGMIRSVVLPYGRGGIIGGTMLGLGRALGETIAVFLIISPKFQINVQILHTGAISVSSLIALRYNESSSFGLSALFAAGLALFTMTLIVNYTASTVVARSRSGTGSDG